MAESDHQIPAVSTALLAAPLQWFWAAHERHRQMCRLLDDLAEADEVWPEATALLLAYIETEIPDHIRDEEDALFPLLRRRCPPQDNIAAVLASLAADHRADIDLAAGVAAVLRDCLESSVPPCRDETHRARLHAFASHERHHLALENAVVLPIAKHRLSEADLSSISRRLLGRHEVNKNR